MNEVAKVLIISQIIEKYKEILPTDWISKHQWDDDNWEESTDSCTILLQKYIESVFFIFCKSVLSGEYIIKPQFLQKLDATIDSINNIDIDVDLENKNQREFLSIFSKSLVQISEYLKRYKLMIIAIGNKYSQNQTNYIVNAYRKDNFANIQSKFSPFYDILFKLTKYDHFLSYDDDKVRDLIIFHSELEEAKGDTSFSEESRLAFNVLDNKCLFLLKKLLIGDNKEFDYMIDFNLYHYDARNFAIPMFTRLDNAFEFYRQDTYSNEKFARDLEYKSSDGSISIGELALLMKYYKDSPNTTYSQIENVLKEFKIMYGRNIKLLSDRPYDKYALNSLKSFMYNCKFSFLISSNEYNFDNLLSDMRDVERIQAQTGIFNFYPYRKAILFLTENVRSIVIEGNADGAKYLQVLKEYIDKFANSINWSREQNFYPIQDVYAGCLVKVDDFGGVFVPSSFCRPIKYTKLAIELSEYRSKLLYLENVISLQREREDIESLKDEIDNSNLKHIEILSLFSAVITFLFGSIGFFSSNKDGDVGNMLCNIGSLGIILLLFVSSMFIVTIRKETSWNEYFKHPRLWFFIITSVLYLALLIFLVIKVF